MACNASGANQIQSGNAGANKVEAGDIVRNDVLGGCGKCVGAFHVAIASGVFFSELHDKGPVAGYCGTGQETASARPPNFPVLGDLFY